MKKFTPILLASACCLMASSAMAGLTSKVILHNNTGDKLVMVNMLYSTGSYESKHDMGCCSQGRNDNACKSGGSGYTYQCSSVPEGGSKFTYFYKQKMPLGSTVTVAEWDPLAKVDTVCNSACAAANGRGQTPQYLNSIYVYGSEKDYEKPYLDGGTRYWALDQAAVDAYASCKKRLNSTPTIMTIQLRWDESHKSKTDNSNNYFAASDISCIANK